MKIIPISSEYIKLDSFLKLADCVPTGGMAKAILQEGAVKVNGGSCIRAIALRWKVAALFRWRENKLPEVACLWPCGRGLAENEGA